MKPATVFYMNDRAGSINETPQFKALKLARDAGIADIVKPGYKVAIKMHMGEYGNAFNLRPQWIRVFVDEVKRLGGYPYVVDCTTLTSGDDSSRGTAEDYLRVANLHGLNESSLGCPVMIADGELGTDDVRVEIPHGVFLKHTYIGKQLLDFDACIVISHFKGHGQGVYGGAIKNCGIGMGSKRGKITTHLYNHPVFGIKQYELDQKRFKETAGSIGYKRTSTGVHLVPKEHEDDVSLQERFIAACPWGLLSKDENGELVWDKEKCSSCNFCYQDAQFPGIMKKPYTVFYMTPACIADSASGYINAMGKDRFLYVNYCFDITPLCDCASWHDRPMIPNLGTFVSRDPVAVDMASLEACEASAVVPGSRATDYGFTEPNTDRFTNCSSGLKISQWTSVNAAEFNGLGTSQYVLVESVPGGATEFWLKPYTPDHTFYMHNNWRFENTDFNVDYDDLSYDELRIPGEQLVSRPVGMVKNITIQEYNENKE